MKNLIVLIAFSLSFTGSALAQRYYAEVFANVQVIADITYAQNYSVLIGSPVLEDLKMDVYYPADDINGHPSYQGSRPVIVLAHSGSFLPKGVFLPFGTKTDSLMIELSSQLAKRGFVVVAMDYRLGWNPLAVNQEDKAKSYINAVYRAQQDMRSVVRWLRKDAAASNQFNIDPYRIIAGGSAEGGTVAVSLSALNDSSELSILKLLTPATGLPMVNVDQLGDIWGNGGDSLNNIENNLDYSSTVQGVLNMGGTVIDTTWINAGEAPIVNFHGSADPMNPFGTAVIIVSATGDPVVEVSGSRDVSKVQDRVGNNALWVSAGFTDPVTTIANSKTPAYEGLFWFGAGYGQTAQANGFEPWAWYDTNEPQIIDAGNPSASFPGPYTGYGSAANPYASRAKAETYMDSILGYFIPRILLTIQAGNIDSLAVETPDSSRAFALGQTNGSITYNINGQVLANGVPVAAGTVYLFGTSTTAFGFDTVATTSISGSGDYSFTGLDTMNVLIYAKPDSTLYPNILPTYLTSAIDWQQATTYYTAGNGQSAEINCVSFSPLATGGNQISGTVQANNILKQAQPLVGQDVFLADVGSGNVVQRSRTSASGQFVFAGLPAGTFELTVPYPGIPMNTQQNVFTFTGNDESIQVNALVDSNEITINVVPASGIAIGTELDGITVGPNPADGYINIGYLNTNGQPLQVQLLNTMGQTVATHATSETTGAQTVHIPVNNLPAQVYFLHLTSGNRQQVRKLIIAR